MKPAADPLRTALDELAEVCPKAVTECLYFGRRGDDAAELRAALDELGRRLATARAVLVRAGHYPGGPAC